MHIIIGKRATKSIEHVFLANVLKCCKSSVVIFGMLFAGCVRCYTGCGSRQDSNVGRSLGALGIVVLMNKCSKSGTSGVVLSSTVVCDIMNAKPPTKAQYTVTLERNGGCCCALGRECMCMCNNPCWCNKPAALFLVGLMTTIRKPARTLVDVLTMKLT